VGRLHRRFAASLVEAGTTGHTTLGRKLTVFFLGFTTLGYLAIETIPTAWLTDFLGEGSVFAIPLAAVLGIPAYINTEASLPLLATLMEGGMGAPTRRGLPTPIHCENVTLRAPDQPPNRFGPEPVQRSRSRRVAAEQAEGGTAPCQRTAPPGAGWHRARGPSARPTG
jgi:hypothetical protein